MWFAVGVASACASGGDKDSGIDVSSLLCTGLTDEEGNVLVPTHASGGCFGALVKGTLVCPDCRIAADQTVTLDWINADDTRYHQCTTADVDEEGNFEVGVVAPSSYAVNFSGRIETGQAAAASIPFDACSEEVTLTQTLVISEE